MIDSLTQLTSPNFDVRDAAVPLRFVVLHYTGMKTLAESLARLRDPAAAVSAHYLIDEQGGILQLVAERDRAWHAGKSFWRGVTDLNSASIGIELQNPGHAFGYRPFPAAQIAALQDLLRDIMARHDLPPEAVLAHADIAPDRKQDPGELFPWRDMAAAGFGLWPEPTAADYAPCNANTARELLRAIGYACPDTDTNAPAALLAFQRRYGPAALTGAADMETVARLRALARRMARDAPTAARSEATD